MGHTDVVPVNPDGWSHDPFGGELIDGEVWGRGAIDMLNLTSSMAVAFKHLATTGFQPKGTLIYFGVADEEAGGLYGAEWALEHHLDALRSDYVLTELGGWSSLGRRRHPPLHRQRRREGARLATSAHHRHARARLDAVRIGQRAGQGRRGRAPPVDVPAGGPDQRHLARPGGGDVAAR